MGVCWVVMGIGKGPRSCQPSMRTGRGLAALKTAAAPDSLKVLLTPADAGALCAGVCGMGGETESLSQMTVLLTVLFVMHYDFP